MDEYKDDFEKAWHHHWYNKKSLSNKLCDSMEVERECCARFFEALNDLGMLDKCYPLESSKKSK